MINAEQLDENVKGLSGYKKTNAMLNEIKKNYKLNMLKNFIDKEAENVHAGGSRITPTAAKSPHNAFTKQSTISQTTDNQTIIRQQIASQFKNF